MKIRKRAVSNPIAEDLVVAILSRLPVKSLLRFACMSKEWYIVLKSSYLVSTHHHRLAHPNSILVSKRTRTSGSNEILLLDESGTNSSLDPSYFLQHARLRDLDDVHIVGSSNGLVLCSIFEEEDDDGPRQVLIVWNPATKQSHYLPKSMPWKGDVEEVRDELDITLVGFELDAYKDDYKVVKILRSFKARTKTNRVSYRAQVFTRSTNSWRILKGNSLSYRVRVQYDGLGRCRPITLNGVLYFLDWGNKGFYILSFDLRNEVFGTISLPSRTSCDPSSQCFLSWKNSLAVAMVAVKHGWPHPWHSEIWVMSTGSTTWTKEKIFDFEPDSVPPRIIGVWKDQILGVVTRKRTHQWPLPKNVEDLVVYDPHTGQKTGELLLVLKDVDDVVAVDYVESLISV